MAVRLVSRNGHRFSEFRELEDSLAAALREHTAILDGEMSVLMATVAPFLLISYITEPPPISMRSMSCGSTARIGDWGHCWSGSSNLPG
jgi:ATP-dependent DNA ligase